jgi:hypothetical protein
MSAATIHQDQLAPYRMGFFADVRYVPQPGQRHAWAG